MFFRVALAGVIHADEGGTGTGGVETEETGFLAVVAAEGLEVDFFEGLLVGGRLFLLNH